jgi:hypothetical protein
MVKEGCTKTTGCSTRNECSCGSIALECYSLNSKDSLKKISKRKVQAYLTIAHENGPLIHLGISALKHCWDIA